MELANCPDDNAPFFIKVLFEEGCGMENLRAFMLITSMQDLNIDFRFYPADIETNSDTCQDIIDHGFFLAVDQEDHIEKMIHVITDASHI